MIKYALRHAGEYQHPRLHGCRRYDYMEVIGRVESGTETKSDAGSQSREPVSSPAPFRHTGEGQYPVNIRHAGGYQRPVLTSRHSGECQNPVYF